MLAMRLEHELWPALVDTSAFLVAANRIGRLAPPAFLHGLQRPRVLGPVHRSSRVPPLVWYHLCLQICSGSMEQQQILGTVHVEQRLALRLPLLRPFEKWLHPQTPFWIEADCIVRFSILAACVASLREEQHNPSRDSVARRLERKGRRLPTISRNSKPGGPLGMAGSCGPWHACPPPDNPRCRPPTSRSSRRIPARTPRTRPASCASQTSLSRRSDAWLLLACSRPTSPSTSASPQSSDALCGCLLLLLEQLLSPSAWGSPRPNVSNKFCGEASLSQSSRLRGFAPLRLSRSLVKPAEKKKGPPSLPPLCWGLRLSIPWTQAVHETLDMGVGVVMLSAALVGIQLMLFRAKHTEAKGPLWVHGIVLGWSRAPLRCCHWAAASYNRGMADCGPLARRLWRGPRASGLRMSSVWNHLSAMTFFLQMTWWKLGSASHRSGADLDQFLVETHRPTKTVAENFSAVRIHTKASIVKFMTTGGNRPAPPPSHFRTRPTRATSEVLLKACATTTGERGIPGENAWKSRVWSDRLGSRSSPQRTPRAQPVHWYRKVPFGDKTCGRNFTHSRRSKKISRLRRPKKVTWPITASSSHFARHLRLKKHQRPLRTRPKRSTVKRVRSWFDVEVEAKGPERKTPKCRVAWANISRILPCAHPTLRALVRLDHWRCQRWPRADCGRSVRPDSDCPSSQHCDTETVVCSAVHDSQTERNRDSTRNPSVVNSTSATRSDRERFFSPGSLSTWGTCSLLMATRKITDISREAHPAEAVCRIGTPAPAGKTRNIDFIKRKSVSGQQLNRWRRGEQSVLLTTVNNEPKTIFLLLPHEEDAHDAGRSKGEGNEPTLPPPHSSYYSGHLRLVPVVGFVPPASDATFLVHMQHHEGAAVRLHAAWWPRRISVLLQRRAHDPSGAVTSFWQGQWCVEHRHMYCDRQWGQWGHRVPVRSVWLASDTSKLLWKHVRPWIQLPFSHHDAITSAQACCSRVACSSAALWLSTPAINTSIAVSLLLVSQKFSPDIRCRQCCALRLSPIFHHLGLASCCVPYV